MKKKLEAELISIAHRILKLKNKSELHQLHQEVQNLYEKLSILRFVENNFSEVKPTIGLSEIEEKIEAAFENQTAIVTTLEVVAEEIAEVETQTEEPASEEEIQGETLGTSEEATEIEEKIQSTSEEIKEAQEEVEENEEEETPTIEESNFKPAFELSFDTKDEDIAEQIKEEIKNVSSQITFDDLLGADYVDPVFVKPEDLAQETKSYNPENVIPIGRSYNDSAPVITLNKDFEGKSISLNDRMAKGIIIGLNDRIAFMSHLFGNSSEDYNRVLSQLMTFDTFEEAKDFIETMVKPDYNHWQSMEEYEERFMEIIEKRFS